MSPITDFRLPYTEGNQGSLYLQCSKDVPSIRAFLDSRSSPARSTGEAGRTGKHTRCECILYGTRDVEPAGTWLRARQGRGHGASQRWPNARTRQCAQQSIALELFVMMVRRNFSQHCRNGRAHEAASMINFLARATNPSRQTRSMPAFGKFAPRRWGSIYGTIADWRQTQL